MSTPVQTGLTYDDLARLPEDELRRHELIDGELFVTPAPVRRHQAVAARIAARLLTWAERHGGEVYTAPGVYLSERTYVVPDVVLVTAATLDGLDPRHVDAVPDLVVEVSSPSTRRYDLVRKRRLYEQRGVPEHWFVDLDADRVEVYRLEGGDHPIPLIVERGGRIAAPQLPRLDVGVDDLLGPSPES